MLNFFILYRSMQTNVEKVFSVKTILVTQQGIFKTFNAKQPSKNNYVESKMIPKITST